MKANVHEIEICTRSKKPEVLNMSNFEPECKYRTALVDIWCNDDGKKHCGVAWQSAYAKKPTQKFNAEIVRVFKANGIPTGTKISIAFQHWLDWREDPYVYELIVK